MPMFRRVDGEVVKDVPPYRRIMPFIMRSRTESAVYFEQRVDMTNALAFITRWNHAHPERRITFFHLLVHEIAEILHERPRLNRFVSGGRLYQRRQVEIAYSAKKAMHDDAPIVALKRAFAPGQTFEERAQVLSHNVKQGKSDQSSAVDKELRLLFLLPLFLVGWIVRFACWLDAWNLLPGAFIRNDPLFASVFLANLGSIKLDAAFHHNYEYGNISIFGTVGALTEVPYVAADGKLASRKEVLLRWTFDERIEDGLYCARSLELLRQRLEAPRTIPAQAESAPISAVPRAG